MMRGSVRNRHVLVPVTFRLTGQPDLTIEFVLDTGFTGFLTLPVDAVTRMRLSFLNEIPADLADDSTVQVSVHAATIVWQGAERDVRVLALGRRPLLGAALLDGHDVGIRYAEGGPVTIARF
jgi:clan AA aspartic protease